LVACYKRSFFLLSLCVLASAWAQVPTYTDPTGAPRRHATPLSNSGGASTRSTATSGGSREQLLRAARAAGCRTLDGGGMVVYQAARAFEIFTGRAADSARMRQSFEVTTAT